MYVNVEPTQFNTSGTSEEASRDVMTFAKYRTASGMHLVSVPGDAGVSFEKSSYAAP